MSIHNSRIAPKILLLAIALAISAAACWQSSSGGGETAVTLDPCSTDAGQMYRCSGDRLQQCDGTSWETVEDCASEGGTCQTIDSGMAQCSSGGPTCTTGETDGKCNAGSRCSTDTDCASGICGDNGKCLTSTCGNGMQDGDETGPDCGGSCPKCVGEPCSRNEHCVTNYCKANVCASPSCTDGEQNGTETGPDCGGNCSPCPVGQGCSTDMDCTTGRCDDNTCAELPATCDDGEKNGSETDIDCGGPNCGACPLQDNCSGDGDCLSQYCKFGVCKEPTCQDNEQNQGEADVDCGGPCEPCGLGKTCQSATDCESERCDGGTCTSCSDGRKNGDETGVDCGGPCHRKCGPGGSCQRDADCDGICEDGTCCRPNLCGNCGPPPQETCNGIDDDCDGQVDEGLGGSAPDCSKQKGVCAGAKADCRGADGWTCDDSTYKSHSFDYKAGRDINCDMKDNDCDGEVDEDPCQDDGDACTEEFCGPQNTCKSKPRQPWEACGSGSSPAEMLKHCNDNLKCVEMGSACICNNQGCVFYDVWSHGGKSTSVSQCRCGYDYVRYDTKTTRCARGTTCQRVYLNGDKRYICPE